MRYFVLGDLHGNHELAVRLLDLANVPTTGKARASAGVHCVQLGDLANCVSSSVDDDVVILERALHWFDVVLVGNHELPHFDGPRFSGFCRDAAVEVGLNRLDQTGILKPCLLIGDTLLTHAGVADEWGYAGPRDAAAAIEKAWRLDDRKWLNVNVIGLIGRARGGRAPYGGITWRDKSESIADFDQVHGHSPVRTGPDWRHKPSGHWSINLDVAAGKGASRIVGLWLKEDGQPTADARLSCLVEYATVPAEAWSA